MPRLNVIAMVVLCVGVAAGAAALALRTPARKDAPRVERLIRQLGDADPDVRRDAERELKALGPKAETALKEAVSGRDPVVADRARALLGLKPEKTAPEGAVAKSPVVDNGIRISLQVTRVPRRPDPIQYYLRLHNGTKNAVALARRLRGGQPLYAGFGAFERIDAEGRLVTLLDSNDDGEFPGNTELEIVIVRPGESLDMTLGAGFVRVEAAGTFRVRFVYDATAGSEYRERIAASHHAESALPAERFESNEVAVTVY